MVNPFSIGRVRVQNFEPQRVPDLRDDEVVKNIFDSALSTVRKERSSRLGAWRCWLAASFGEPRSAVGNDGLTDAERSERASLYLATAGSPVVHESERSSTDNGIRHDLDDVIADLGIDISE